MAVKVDGRLAHDPEKWGPVFRKIMRKRKERFSGSAALSILTRMSGDDAFCESLKVADPLAKQSSSSGAKVECAAAGTAITASRISDLRRRSMPGR